MPRIHLAAFCKTPRFLKLCKSPKIQIRKCPPGWKYPVSQPLEPWGLPQLAAAANSDFKTRLVQLCHRRCLWPPSLLCGSERIVFYFSAVVNNTTRGKRHLNMLLPIARFNQKFSFDLIFLRKVVFQRKCFRMGKGGTTNETYWLCQIQGGSLQNGKQIKSQHFTFKLKIKCYLN